MSTILHITPHLGGGVGRFLANIVKADDQNQHEFCLLEAPNDKNLIRELSWRIIDEIHERFFEYINKFDIIQLEFWNHPLFFKFLLDYKLPDCRLIIYAHVSGLYAPNIIPQGLFDFADTIILSTPASMDYYMNQIQRGKCQVIHGVGGVTRTSSVKRVPHIGINIAYIGTSSYSKLHPGFVQACRKLLKYIPEVRYVVASNDDNYHLQVETKRLGINNYFDFFYRTDNIGEILARTDLFGYPLRSDHFGTGEQVLLEAMGAGVAPVVIGNLAEKSLIKDGETGVIAYDIEDYVESLQYCIEHPDFVNRIGAQAKAFALKYFTVEKTIELFSDLYKQVMIKPKTPRNFTDCFSIEKLYPGWSLYKLCLGNYSDLYNYENADNKMLEQYFRSKIVRSPQLMSVNKGGMRMYHKHFPEDKRLSQFIIENT